MFYLLLILGSIEAKAAPNKDVITKETSAKSLFEALKANPWANINGFRSAKFGMDQKGVYRAIAKDFKLAKSKVTKQENPAEKTTSLTVSVPDLFSTGGTAKIGYVLGYKSKKLIHVNVMWGDGASENVDGQSVLQTANLLRTHFLKKRYQKEKLAANATIGDNQTLVFRGLGQKKRMITVLLVTGTIPGDSSNKISLILSYIKDPENPDIRIITIISILFK